MWLAGIRIAAEITDALVTKQSLWAIFGQADLTAGMQKALPIALRY
jgi:hypothetical protein